MPWVLTDTKNIYYCLQQNNLSANQESFLCICFVLKNETDKSDFVIREIKIAWNTSCECSQPPKARPWTVRVNTNTARKIVLSCLFLVLCGSLAAAYHLSFSDKPLSEESPRSQPENRLSLWSLRQYSELTKLIHATLLIQPYERAIPLTGRGSSTRKEATGLGLKCFPSAAQVTLCYAETPLHSQYMF